MAQRAGARPYIAPDLEMAHKADAIAVIYISTPEVRGGSTVAATVVQTVKGTLPTQVRLASDWECPAVREPGQYLAFLTSLKEDFLGSNCYASYLPVVNGKVRWGRNMGAGKKGNVVLLKKALKEIIALDKK